MAQSGLARLHGVQEVRGSNPLTPTSNRGYIDHLHRAGFPKWQVQVGFNTKQLLEGFRNELEVTTRTAEYYCA